VDYLWPRILLLVCSVLYGSNFPAGRLMNDALPASATTSARFVLASLALSPFLPKLDPKLRSQAALCGCFTALGYVSQSLALVDTSATVVSLLGALIVVWTPVLPWLLDKKPSGLSDIPQTWLAAFLAFVGVALLEIPADGGSLSIKPGDAISTLQAVGFGTSFYLTEKLMSRNPTQALPITGMQVLVVALISAVWAAADGLGVGPLASGADAGWLLDSRVKDFALPGLLLQGASSAPPFLAPVPLAVVWTGVATTALNRVGETTALGKMSSAEAAVLLATEPLWAAVFAALFVGESITTLDVAGGVLIIGACVVNAAAPKDVLRFFGAQVKK
jgi:drug/metabolite transporter (DMT)-like permease